MSLYFDSKVQSPDPGCININVEWHEQHPLLAVSSYSQDRGGFVTIYDELVLMCYLTYLFFNTLVSSLAYIASIVWMMVTVDK